MNSTRVALFRGSQVGHHIEEVPLQLEEGEVLVQVRLTSICASDLHSYAGRRSCPTPCVLGHEIVGEIVDARGDNLGYANADNKIQIGDRVTWSLTVSCKTCDRCRRGIPQKCQRVFKFGHDLFRGSNPSGGFAEHCVLPSGTDIFKLPDTLSDEECVAANCALGTAAAALDAADTSFEGRRVLVQGAGMVGLALIGFASYQGAEVIVSEPSEHRREWARRFGAADVLDPTTSWTEFDPVDVAWEVSGQPAAINTGLELVDTGGMYVLVGSVFPSPPWSIDPESVVRNLWTIRGVHNYSPRDLRVALDLLERTQSLFPWADCVETIDSLSSIDEALARAASSYAPRVAIRPGRNR
ncbi:MAG: zinc-binding dehydrogenase [Planctomycetota bacterium]